MLSSLLHMSIILPAAGLVAAVCSGIVIRRHSARKDRQLRDLRFSD